MTKFALLVLFHSLIHLPWWAQEKYVLSLRKWDHLALQSQAANLCSCEFIFTLRSLYIQ